MRLLAIDPLNEEAVLCRAESLALQGQKSEAVHVLDNYAREVGSSAPMLRLQVDIMRRRIAERSTPEPSEYPLIGRSVELAELLALYQESASGRGTLSIIWGDAGIGKTRLVQELHAHLTLRSALVVLARCRPHDIGRPLGALLDVLPVLLQARGALGVSPDSHTILRSLLVTHRVHPVGQTSAWVAASVRTALDDLLTSVASEQPLVLIIEDAQWLDEPSVAFVANLPGSSCAIQVVMTYRSNCLPPSFRTCATHVRKLAPLQSAHATDLLIRAIGQDTAVESGLLDRCVALAAGNALFIRTIGENFRRNGTEPFSHATVHDLLRQRVNVLSPTATLVLRTLVGLGIHGSHDRLSRSLALTPGTMLLAIQELAELNLVVQSAEALQCAHDLIGDVVIAETPRPVLSGVMTRAAEVLEEEGVRLKHPALLWSCAERWELASNRTRAAKALRQCCHLATNVGEARFAIEALEKAQGCVPEIDLGPLIEDTIRIADDSWEPEAVFRNLERIREWRRRQGRDPTGSTIAELAAINADRRTEQPVWDRRAPLRRCVDNHEATIPDRLRAARVFLLVAEEQLDHAAAAAMHTSVLASVDAGSEPAAWRHYSLTYHGTFGSLVAGACIAREILARRASNDPPVLSAVNHSAFVLFRSGEPELACTMYKDFLALAQKARFESHTTAQYAAQLAMMLIHVGDYEQATHYNTLAQRSISALGRQHTGGILSNHIDLALARSDIDEAIRLQGTLRAEYSSQFTPNRERNAVGNDLLIAAIQGRPINPDTVSRAEALFQRGASLSEADTLACGLAISLSTPGDSRPAQELFERYMCQLRRDQHSLAPHLDSLLGKAIGQRAPISRSLLGASRE